MKNLKQWLQPGQLNKNLVLEILKLLLEQDKPIKVKVDQEVTVKSEKPSQIFDDLKENNATKFIPKRAD
jgi:predicted Zn-ribbon and HTH transcriptional regulator